MFTAKPHAQSASVSLTVVYYLAFLTSLLVFHAIQWACYYAFGNQAHKWSVNLLNATLIGCLGLIGTKISFSNPHKLRNDKPHISVQPPKPL